MVALRQYKPQNLNINPAAVAQQLAQTIDVDGVLSQISKWDALSRQQATTDSAQIEAENQQRNAGFRDATTEEMKAQIEAGNDPLQLDPLDIAKKIGDYESILKISNERRQAESEAPLKDLEVRSKLAKLGALDPQGAMGLSQRLGIQGWQAPPQKSKGGDGEAKKVEPQIVINPDTGEARVDNASEDGFIPLDLVQKAQGMGIDLSSKSKATPAPQEGPGIIKQSMDFISSLTGGSPSATPGPVATPGAMQRPPPGHLLVRDKVTGEVKIIKK